ncbi:MAG: hypothetical protein HYY16_03090 [Planctomycetes bacterium]|nr:hypothetical protein [Planctomycetota bacterium]
MVRSVVICLVLSGCAAAVPPTVRPGRSTASEYQPLEIGWRWTYAIEGGGTCQRTVVGRENVGRFDCRVVEETAGERRAKWWLRSDRDGLKLFRAADETTVQDMEDAAIWFKYPPSRGERWRYDAWHGMVELQCYGVYEDDERVRVPAGEFTCARVRTFGFCEQTQVFEKVEWYAKGIGLVRQWVKYYDGRQAAMDLREMAR